MMWRNVSFVESIELHFPGNVVTSSMDLGDVDNDGENELVVGNIEGGLGIFKGDCSSPLMRASNLGMITCLKVGDIFNVHRNYLVVLTAEGILYIFDVKPIPTVDDLRGEEEGHKFAQENRLLIPICTQRTPANSKSMLLDDTNGDGQVELAVTYADRAVRTFRWQTTGETTTHSVNPFPGRLQLIDKWQLAGQVGSMSIGHNAEGMPELIASQPGRTYVTLTPSVPPSQTPSTPLSPITESEEPKASFVFHPLGHSRVRNKEITTVIVGGITRDSGQGNASTYCALASLDGTIVLVEEDMMHWSLQVDHRLFVIDKLDVTGNGQQEVVCCSWDGQTYIVNHSREVVRFHFKENVQAFTAGYYSIPGKGNVPCFVYNTFKNELHVYHSIDLPSVESASLVQVMEKKQTTPQLLEKLGVDGSNPENVCSLYHWALYGWRPK